MHFVLSWVTQETGPERLTLEKELKGCFESHESVRPFNGLFKKQRIGPSFGWP